MSVGSTFGRLFFGKLCDHPRVNRLYCFQIAMLVIGVADTLSTLTKSYAGLVVYMVVFGVFDGCFVVLLAVLCADIVGVDKVAAGIGVQFFFMAITSIAGPPLAGNADNFLVCKWIHERSDIWIAEKECKTCLIIWCTQPVKTKPKKEMGWNPVQVWIIVFSFQVLISQLLKLCK